MAGHISIAEQAMKKETAEEREDRLYFSKVFDLQEWGNRHLLYLFAYSIHYMVLPLEYHQPEIKRKTGICGYIFDPSQMKRMDIDSEL
jgi:hypothetical protein